MNYISKYVVLAPQLWITWQVQMDLHISHVIDAVWGNPAMAKLVVSRYFVCPVHKYIFCLSSAQVHILSVQCISTHFVCLSRKTLNRKINAVSFNIIIPLNTTSLLLIDADVDTKLWYGDIYLMAGPSKDINRIQRLHPPTRLAINTVSSTSMTKTLCISRNKITLSSKS